MAFGWAGAAAGASRALADHREHQQRQQEREQSFEELLFQRKMQELANARAETQLGMQRDQFTAEQAHRAGQTERQARLDAEAAAERARRDAREDTRDRQDTNAREVRRLLGMGIVQRGGQPLAPEDRLTMQGMALQEGVDLPGELLADPGSDFTEFKRRAQFQDSLTAGREARADARSEQFTRRDLVGLMNDARTRAVADYRAMADEFGQVTDPSTGQALTVDDLARRYFDDSLAALEAFDTVRGGSTGGRRPVDLSALRRIVPGPVGSRQAVPAAPVDPYQLYLQRQGR